MKRFTAILCISFLFSCNDCDWTGSHDLGNGLALMEGDRIEDRVIIRCTGRSQGCCKGGVPILPTYERHIVGGEYNEFVEAASFDDHWIIARTKIPRENKTQFWIINKDFDLSTYDCLAVNCDSIVLSKVSGPWDEESFARKKDISEINLSFKDNQSD